MGAGGGPAGRTLIRLLLRLFPSGYRETYRGQLAAAYEETIRSERDRGRSRLNLAVWLIWDALKTGRQIRRAATGEMRSAEGSVGRGSYWGREMMGSMLRELRLAVRSLTRSPGFAAVTVLTMAIGIGINAAIFSVVHSVLLAPFPFQDADQLVTVENRYLESGATGWISSPEFDEYRTPGSALSQLVAITPESSNLNGGEVPIRLQGLRVTAGFFELLGIQPMMGRTLNVEDELQGATPIVVSHRVWRDALGSDPEVIGRTIDLGGEARTVVGVGPEGAPSIVSWLFAGRGEDFWIPVQVDSHLFDTRLVERHNLFGIGRLAPGISANAAGESFTDAVVRLERKYPEISAAGSRGWRCAACEIRWSAMSGARSCCYRWPSVSFWSWPA